MANLATTIFSHPVKSINFLYSFTIQFLIVSIRKLLLPHIPHYQSFRLQVQRAFLTSTTVTFPELPHRLPVTNCPEHEARKLGGKEWTAYIVPGTQTLDEFISSNKHSSCVVLYAHGGGYFAGEARMYRYYMNRWVTKAAKKGIHLVFVSVEYPLTSKLPHPAQRDSFVNVYRYLLNKEVPSDRVLFMGDSAGGGLCILSGLQLNNQDLPQPAGNILISPWIDLSLPAFEGGNALVETDFVVKANSNVAQLAKIFLNGIPSTSPEVNPIYRTPDELKFLPPTLILAGGAEFALQEAKDFGAQLNAAGVKCELRIEWGQMHIYALGSAFIDPKVREWTDMKILDWVSACIGV